MRKLMLVAYLYSSTAIAHECQLPPAEYDHAPSPLPVETKIPWDHIAQACGWDPSLDTPPQIPMLYAGGGAELFSLSRPMSCRWRELGVWHINLPEGGGWTDGQVDQCRRFEWGSINGWKHRDPRE